MKVVLTIVIAGVIGLFVWASIDGGLIREGESKAYDVSSPIPKVQEIIDERKIKYINTYVWTFLGFDYRKGEEEFFAMDVSEENWLIVQKMTYRKIPDDIAKELQLSVNYTFIEKHGRLGWGLIALVLVWMFYSIVSD